MSETESTQPVPMPPPFTDAPTPESPPSQPDTVVAPPAPTILDAPPPAEPFPVSAPETTWDAAPVTEPVVTGPTEPEFPRHIRFEIGTVHELKTWIESWFAWKTGQS
jgi:hypothetical protein